MIEKYNPYIENLLLKEPWRAGEGVGNTPCTGSLDWDGSRYWMCTCGRIGCSPNPLHLPLVKPKSLVLGLLLRFAAAFQKPVPQPA